VHVTARGKEGGPLALTFAAGAAAVTLNSAVPLARAARHALDDVRLREQLGRLGETPFELGTLDTAGLAEGLFLPVSVLNDLRQEAVRRLLALRDERSVRVLEERIATIDAALVVEPSTGTLAPAVP